MEAKMYNTSQDHCAQKGDGSRLFTSSSTWEGYSRVARAGPYRGPALGVSPMGQSLLPVFVVQLSATRSLGLLNAAFGIPVTS
ncbi:hypothetical protein PM082_002386 [Marasmius tenuissimus]|nr:hypothetical protein PM082_002386 [Marasmius tenuissimus]